MNPAQHTLFLLLAVPFSSFPRAYAILHWSILMPNQRRPTGRWRVEARPLDSTSPHRHRTPRNMMKCGQPHPARILGPSEPVSWHRVTLAHLPRSFAWRCRDDLRQLAASGMIPFNSPNWRPTSSECFRVGSSPNIAIAAAFIGGKEHPEVSISADLVERSEER